MRTSIAAGGVCLAMMGSCFAQTSTTAKVRIETHIPPQALGSALTQFGKLEHIHVLFLTANVRGLRTLGASGYLTADEALTRLLSGTGLNYRYVDGDAVSIVARTTQIDDQRRKSATPEDPPQSTKRSASGGALSAAKRDSVTTSPSAQTLQQVTVTGTHIIGAPLASPLITLDQQAIARTGLTSVGDVITAIPQDYGGGNTPRTALSQAPGSDNASPSGGFAPDLRGLGSGSTLTLVDGTRLAQNSPNGAADISFIPFIAISGIDVLLDGASATYGSDAVAGVVNIRTLHNVSTTKATLTLSDPTDGGGFDRQASALTGTEWATGGIVAAYEFDHLDAVYSDQRDFTLSAYRPATLLPSNVSNSGYLSLNQEISVGTKLSMDGFYSTNRGMVIYSYGNTPSDVYPYNVSGNQYLVTSSIVFSKIPSWLLSASGSAGRDYNDELHSSIDFDEVQVGRTKTAEIDGNGPLLTLRSHTVSMAVGGGYRTDSYQDITNQAGIRADASRSVSYGFTELSLPIGKLDFSASGRYESFADGRHSAIPKFGMVWRLADYLSLKTSWGRSFREPPLTAEYGPNDATLFTIPDPNSPSGMGTVLIPGGGNANLKPESARTWTLGLYFHPSWKHIQASINYFNIEYTDRLASYPSIFSTLTDPADELFVTRNPSPALQQSYISAANGQFFNFTGAQYNPADVVAIVDGRDFNFTREQASGLDAEVKYSRSLGTGQLDAFMDSSYLSERQRFTPQSPEVMLSGISFGPPRIRARAGVTWVVTHWSASGVVNYIGSESNNYVPTVTRVSPWVTGDVRIAYQPGGQGLSSGLDIALSITNLANSTPPYMQFNDIRPGFNYDTVNTSPIGRIVTLRLSQAW